MCTQEREEHPVGIRVKKGRPRRRAALTILFGLLLLFMVTICLSHGALLGFCYVEIDRAFAYRDPKSELRFDRVGLMERGDIGRRISGSDLQFEDFVTSRDLRESPQIVSLQVLRWAWLPLSNAKVSFASVEDHEYLVVDVLEHALSTSWHSTIWELYGYRFCKRVRHGSTSVSATPLLCHQRHYRIDFRKRVVFEEGRPPSAGSRLLTHGETGLDNERQVWFCRKVSFCGEVLEEHEWYESTGYRRSKKVFSGPKREWTVWNDQGKVILQVERGISSACRRCAPWLWGACDQSTPTLTDVRKQMSAPRREEAILPRKFY